MLFQQGLGYPSFRYLKKDSYERALYSSFLIFNVHIYIYQVMVSLRKYSDAHQLFGWLLVVLSDQGD